MSNGDALFRAAEHAGLHPAHAKAIDYDSCGKDEIALGPAAGGENFARTDWVQDSELHPLECALFPYPDVAYDQDSQEDHHFNQAEYAQVFELTAQGNRKMVSTSKTTNRIATM